MTKFERQQLGEGFTILLLLKRHSGRDGPALRKEDFTIYGMEGNVDSNEESDRSRWVDNLVIVMYLERHTRTHTLKYKIETNAQRTQRTDPHTMLVYSVQCTVYTSAHTSPHIHTHTHTHTMDTLYRRPCCIDSFCFHQKMYSNKFFSPFPGEEC